MLLCVAQSSTERLYLSYKQVALYHVCWVSRWRSIVWVGFPGGAQSHMDYIQHGRWASRGEEAKTTAG
jgi:hypothetical protein